MIIVTSNYEGQFKILVIMPPDLCSAKSSLVNHI